MKRYGSLASEYYALTYDERVELLQHAKYMFGDAINKYINEIYESTTTTTDKYNFGRTVEYVMYAVAEEKFKNLPKTWELIKKKQIRSPAQ